MVTGKLGIAPGAIETTLANIANQNKPGKLPKLYKPSRIFLEPLEGYVEAAKVKLLTEFTENAER